MRLLGVLVQGEFVLRILLFGIFDLQDPTGMVRTIIRRTFLFFSFLFLQVNADIGYEYQATIEIRQ